MNETIWKYSLGMGRTVVKMPSGAQVLTVQVQRETVCLWALVDLEGGLEERVFMVYGTGHPIAEGAKLYVGSVLTYGGMIVLHVFEEVEETSTVGLPLAEAVDVAMKEFEECEHINRSDWTTSMAFIQSGGTGISGENGPGVEGIGGVLGE